MITLELNEHTVEDFKDALALQELGIPDEMIQEYYNRELERRERADGRT